MGEICGNTKYTYNVYTYVRTEINTNVFTPLSIQFGKLTFDRLRCSALILTRHMPSLQQHQTENGAREENDDTICSISGQYQVLYRRVSAIIA